VTFPVAVDTADVFGAAFGLKAIPVTFFVDEVGIVRLQGGGPNATLLRDIEALLAEPVMSIRATQPQLPSARSRAELEHRIAKSPEDWRSRLALARLHVEERRYPDAAAQFEAAVKLQPRSAEIQFAWGLAFLHQGRKEKALTKMKLARDFDPENWRIRKQIWAIENPGKFYTAESPDYGWQKEQLDRERKGAD
jgi:tetratricopeptide (TPR) repeat protein